MEWGDSHEQEGIYVIDITKLVKLIKNKGKFIIMGSIFFTFLICAPAALAYLAVFTVFKISVFSQGNQFLEWLFPLIEEPSMDYLSGAVMGILFFLIVARLMRLKVNFDPDQQPLPKKRAEE